MNFEKAWISAALLGSLLWFADTSPARAALNECGGIFLSADSKCEYREKEQCMTECTTATVETACVAQIYTTCQNQCTTTASASCESSCSQGCTTECQTEVATPQPPSCMELCASDCEHTCQDGGKGERGGCCSHTCNAHCEDKCKNSPAATTKPEECTTTCMNACSGSCTAQVNVQCQLDCQTNTYTQCQTELVQTCETKCMDDGGAIFCDGQFVNASNANSCSSELKTKFNFDIKVAASTAAGAVSNAVDSTKKKAQNCAVSQVGATTGGTGPAALLALCATLLGVHRSRKRPPARDKR
jgi:hypothetical protein